MDWDSKFGRKVKRLIKRNYVIWFTTVDANLTPQPRPVWFIREGDSFLLFSKPNARKVRHLLERPGVSLHFNTDATGDRDVVVLIGTAAIDESLPPAHQIPAYLRKYRSGIKDLEMTAEEFSQAYSVAIRVTPTSMRGW